jgi:hypothetical protein
MDLQCPFCPKTSSRGTGLASHIRGAHPKQYAGWSKARKSGGPVPAAIPSPATATFGFGDIVAQLEQQRDAIAAALTALRAIGGAAAPAEAPVAAPKGAAQAKRKRQLSPEGRERLIAALKRRWAKAKGKGKRGRPKKIG